MSQHPFAVFLLVACMVTGCTGSSPKELLVGSWQIIPHGEAATLEAVRSDLGLLQRKTVLIFHRDGTVKSQNIVRNAVENERAGTYTLEDEGKTLIIYRERKLERKNTSVILQLSESALSLIDVSGSGDTMHLKRIN